MSSPASALDDAAPPGFVTALVRRFDPAIFDTGGRRSVVRVRCDAGRWDISLSSGQAWIEPALLRRTPDCRLIADAATWRDIAADVRGGLDAYAKGRLRIRGSLHVAVGFLAATATDTRRERLRVLSVETSAGRLSTYQAGRGTPVLMLHGLGASKAEFLPTIAALAPRFRTVALDLPGFGESVKPLGAPYDARFFASATIALADALGIERFHVVGHSMGGRAALEVGLLHPRRVISLALLTPSLSWLRDRPWAAALRLLRPELGVLHPAPRALIERVVHRVVPGAGSGVARQGIDEFLRAYCTPRGRAAFYAAARNIYLEEPGGDEGLWTRLATMVPPCLFVWGSRDGLVPPAFARHVERVLPSARHVHLDTGHLPQFERPEETHKALLSFLGG